VTEEAVAALARGEPVLLPTDTVYGLCARAGSREAVERALALKGRGTRQPSALLAGSLDQLLESVPELPDHAAVVARALLPGPYTLVVPNPARRFPWLSGERSETIGVRVPYLSAAVRDVLDRAGAVMATSANRHGGADPRRLDHVPPEIRAGCGAEVDAGELPGVPSTVVDLTGPEPRVLREGAVPAAADVERVAAALGTNR
jgi:L-threonylcarbamoyladenylate synthase